MEVVPALKRAEKPMVNASGCPPMLRAGEREEETNFPAREKHPGSQPGGGLSMSGKPRGNPGHLPGYLIRQGRVNRLAHIGYHDDTTAPVSMAAAYPIPLVSFLFFPGLHPIPPNSPCVRGEGPRKTRRGPSCHSRARGETRVQTGGRNCRRKGRRFRQGRVEDWNKEETSRVELKDGGRL